MSQHKHAPRECRLVKSELYSGYGFNLYQEKNKPGQFIGRIEPGSPADLAGLKENDRLVEVNRVNIGGENHKQVVARIKSCSNETVLLVADSEADQYHKDRGIVITNSLNYLIKKSNVEEDEEDPGENPVEDPVEDPGEDPEEVIDTRLQTVTFQEREPVREAKKAEVSVSRQDSGVSMPSSPQGEAEVLGLGLSVQEMKDRLRQRRRHDPRLDPRKRQSGDWWNQYKMIQTL